MSDYKDVIEDMKKQFGDDSVRVASEYPEIKSTPTGIYDLDKKVLGVGGIPAGRLIEIFGPPSSGKTSLAEHVMAKLQQKGGTVALFDLEGRYDPKWAEKAGLNNDELIKPVVNYGEEVYDQIIFMIGKVDLILVDSLATIISMESLSKDISEKEAFALNARLNTSGISKIIGGKFDDKKNRVIPRINDTNTTVIFVNQIRDEIGIRYGDPIKTPGGHALKHLGSIRLKMSNPRYEKDGEFHKQRVNVKCVKNSLAPPLREAEFFLTEENVLVQDDASIILNEAIDKEFVEKRGAWYYSEYFPEEKVHGKPKFDEWLQTTDGEGFRKMIMGE